MSGSAAFLRGVLASPFVLVGIASILKWPLETIGIILLFLAPPMIWAARQGSAEVDHILERERMRQKQLAFEATVGALSPPQASAQPVATLELVIAPATPEAQPLPDLRPRRRARRP
jgi:hypothetical protein